VCLLLSMQDWRIHKSLRFPALVVCPMVDRNFFAHSHNNLIRILQTRCIQIRGATGSAVDIQSLRRFSSHIRRDHDTQLGVISQSVHIEPYLRAVIAMVTWTLPSRRKNYLSKSRVQTGCCGQGHIRLACHLSRPSLINQIDRLHRQI